MSFDNVKGILTPFHICNTGMQDCNTKHDYKVSLRNIKGQFSARFLLRYASWILDKPTREMTIQYRYYKKEFF